MEIPIYIILGLFVGVLGGLFGIGGGVIIVPALLFIPVSYTHLTLPTKVSV